MSPSGTKNEMLSTRHYDDSKEGLDNWGFMTVHCWGEYQQAIFLSDTLQPGYCELLISGEGSHLVRYGLIPFKYLLSLTGRLLTVGFLSLGCKNVLNAPDLPGLSSFPPPTPPVV